MKKRKVLNEGLYDWFMKAIVMYAGKENAKNPEFLERFNKYTSDIDRLSKQIEGLIKKSKQEDSNG